MSGIESGAQGAPGAQGAQGTPAPSGPKRPAKQARPARQKRQPRPAKQRAPRTRAQAERARNARMWIAGGVAFALVATIAVIAQGYDARETPRVEPGVWVARDAGQYARVNTDTGELDLVRKATEPSGVVQAGDRALVLSHGNGRAWPIDAANPTDLTDRAPQGGDTEAADGDGGAGGDAETAGGAGSGSTDGSEASTAAAVEGTSAVGMPDGTRDVVTEGRFVAVRTEAGAVFVGTLADAAPGSPGAAETATLGTPTGDLASRLESLTPVDPLAAEAAAEDDGAAEDGAAAEGTDYTADAVSVSADGMVAMYSAAEGAVHRYDIAGAEFAGDADRVPGEDAAEPQLTLLGDDWALLDGADGRLWRGASEPVELSLGAAAKLQAPTDRARDDIRVADDGGLWSVSRSGEVAREVEADGVPARPTAVDGELVAAWLGASSGALWTGDGEPRRLQFDDAIEPGGEWEPVIRSNGARAVLSEEQTGMLWTVPDGAMIPVSQWSISDPPKENRGEIVVDEVTEQVPPTAVPDEFGVRAGEPAPLPLLLNDFDPNTSDVLTILPESLGENGLPEEFGALQIASDGQSLIVSPAPGAEGSATFTYRITDGALKSEPATVTLHIAPDDVNSAPAWCPVEGCQREWGVPAIVPGGTLVAPLLEGWVDPEGDVMMLVGARAANAEDPVRAIVTADGRLAVRHLDPNAGASDIGLDIVVRDSRGEERHRELQLAVQPDALAKFTSSAATVTVGRSLTVEPLDRVAGGSGSFALLDAVVQSGTAEAKPNRTAGSIVLSAESAGVSNVTVTVQDTVTGGEITGTIKVTAQASPGSLVLPPLRAFVRPLSDTTVEVLDALPGAAGRALSVVSADVAEGELRADVIDHEMVRVAGTTADGAPGKVGTVDLTIAEDDRRGTGRLTVFQVPEGSVAGAISVSDHATVRAGAVVDIPVLQNDVGAPGERLLLHPDVSGSGTKGELAFAAGGTLRYLAPQQAGTYRLGYTVFGASSPEASDVGTVIVTVVPKGSNREPNPAPLTARVAPGEDASVQVPLSGVDPDGDRVRLIDVTASEDPQVTASVADSGSAIDVAASETAKAGVRTLRYEVRDSGGGSASGVLRVIVTDGGDGGQPPIPVTDRVRLVPGGDAATVRPLDNDLDPARGKLTLVEVVPNVPGGEGSAEYERLAERLDASDLESGRITVLPGEEAGTVSYRYRVRSSESKSTADGLVVVQTSARVGAQAPAVTDTVLNVRDRARLSAEGVDVLTGKVRWATGDASKLKLSVWKGNAGEYRASGTSIVGAYNPDGDTVVFRVTGVDSTGKEVSSYGFLQIPPLDELRVTLKPGVRPLQVDENESVDARIADLVDLGPDDQAELRQGSYPVSRGNARCEAVSGGTIRYTAGKEAPWVDTCLMDVRLRGQKLWTTLPVPVAIVPKDPTAELRPLTRTVAPGTEESIALTDMVEWPGGREGDASKLRFSVQGGGSRFDVSAQGSSAVVSAHADATPGSQEVVTVSVTGAGESSSSLTLRVGEAPRDAPRGGTVSLKCTVGADCSTALIGVPGEYDPFAGKAGAGLDLVSVDAGSCAVGSFAAAGDRATVSWAGGRVTGGTCTGSFTVKDAQGRTGTGSIELDAQGRPEAPTSITQTAYGDSSATFSVTLSGQSYPAVTGVQLSGAGSTSCSPAGPASYQCVANGLRNGEKHEFSARAVNAVGESAPSNSVTAWAYRAPDAPEVEAEPAKNPSNTDQGSGAIRITINGSNDTREFRVSVGGTSLGTLPGPNATREFGGIGAGAKTVTAVPVTAHEVPPIGTGSATGSEGTANVTVIGAPKLSSATLSSTGNDSARIDAEWSAHGGESIEVRYNLAEGGGADCSGSKSGNTFSNLKRLKQYTGIACAKSDYGQSTRQTNTVRIGDALPQMSASYAIQAAPNVSGGTLRYPVATGLAHSGTAGGNGQNTAKAQWAVDGAIVGEQPPQIDESAVHTYTVRQCTDFGDEGTCSPWSAPASYTGAAAPATVSPTGECWDEAAPPANPISLFTVSPAAGPYATAAAAGAGQNGKIPVTISWSGTFGGLQQTTVNVCFTPKPAPEPPPTP